MPTENDWLNSDVRTRYLKERAEQELQRRGEQKNVALKAQSVIDHPGWAWLDVKVQEARTLEANRLEVLKDRLATHALHDAEMRWCQAEAREVLGKVRAYEEVLRLVTEAVKADPL